VSVLKKILSLAAAAFLMSGSAMYAGQSPATKGKTQDKHEFTVVIDAGHGGHDVGATDNGIREKDVNLGVAKKLAEMLGKKRKDVKVVMTRDKDEFISLQERADIANRNRGDLFISIHTNSVDKKNSNRKKVEGSSVYALGLHKDANNLKVAQRENSVIELESNYEQKYSGFDPKKDESYIIFEMAQKRNLGHSLKFAGEAQKQLVKVAERVDRGVKQAGFWVLWATSMPSVLVELDFICNPKSAKFIGSVDGQQKMAQALFNAIENYEASVNMPSVDSRQKGKDDSGKKDRKKDRKDKKRKSRSAVAEASEVPAAAPVVEEVEDDAIPVLASSYASARVRKAKETVPKREERSYNFAESRSRSLPVGKRKRRSASARRESDSRDVTGAKIILRSETDLLAKVEEKKVESEVPVITQEEPKDKNNKKNKNRKEGKAKDNKSKHKVDKKVKNQNVQQHVMASSAGDVKRKDNKGTDLKKVSSTQKSKRHTSLARKRNRDKKEKKS